MLTANERAARYRARKRGEIVPLLKRGPKSLRRQVVQPAKESYRLIPLTQDQNAIVDAEDFERISQWNWYAHWNGNTFYALRKDENRKCIPMQRVILESETQVDHRDHDGLNNRKENLRPCTSNQNLWNRRRARSNTSGYKGVCPRNGKWFAYIGIRNKQMNLGIFSTAEQAANAYNAAAREAYGEFAVLNEVCGS